MLKEQYTKLFAEKVLMIKGKIGYEDKYGKLYDFKVEFTITTPRKNPRVGFQISRKYDKSLIPPIRRIPIRT